MVTKQEIQEWIKNNPYATNSKLVKQFGISKQKASANLIAYRKKKGIKKSVGYVNNKTYNFIQKYINLLTKINFFNLILSFCLFHYIYY